MTYKKYDLAKMLEKIENDTLAQKEDRQQEVNISQDTITQLMLDALNKKKKEKNA